MWGLGLGTLRSSQIILKRTSKLQVWTWRILQAGCVERRKQKASTVQTKLVSFLTPASVKGSQTSSQTQLVITHAPEPCPCESSESKQPEIEGDTTDSKETELESHALIPSGNRSATPNTSKVLGLHFDSDSDSEFMSYPQHAIISERKQLELELQLSVKEEQSTPKKSGHGKIQATLSIQNWLSRSLPESTCLHCKEVVSSQGENKRAIARGNLGESESCNLNSTMKSHRLFMMH